jgi:hypothetical protein
MKRKLSDLWTKIRGQEVAPRTEYMEKLRGRKAEVSEALDKSRAATRFEAPPVASTPTFLEENAGAAVDEPLLGGATPSDAPKSSPTNKPAASSLAPDKKQPPAESYTNRLLKAKQKVWEEREKDKDKDK